MFMALLPRLTFIGLLAVTVKLGVQTPGVQIPVTKLKPEAVEAASGNLQTCATQQRGFGSDWVLNCADGILERRDTKTAAVEKTIKTGAAAHARAGLAVSPDSVWLFTDEKTTLSRVDPAENKIVAEMRLGAGCNSIAFGETSLWVTCPSEKRVLRIDPLLNVVSQRIEVSAEPFSIAVGEGSVWVFCRKDGKVERIDPKTNKVSKTIELAVPNAEGCIAVGEGSVWVTMPGFPLSRIDPKTEKVVQQFVGEGGGSIKTSQGAILLTNVKENNVWRLDPRRVLATMAE
jgi:virginiamycin B lyase